MIESNVGKYLMTGTGKAEKLQALAESTTENIKQLKRIIPDLNIDEQSLINKLRNVTTKDEIKKIISTVQKAIAQWEGTVGKNALNVEIETDLSKQFGYKHAHQIEMGKFLGGTGVNGVKMPLLNGISDPVMQSFLKKYAPTVDEQWQKLNQLFNESKDKNAFLKQEEVKKILENIQEAITKAFQNSDDFPFPKGFLPWLDEIKESGSYLMVRSSGAEDSRNTANAGGNVSDPYVKPEKNELCHSLGKVVASYFGASSLQNRINGGENPFSNPNMASVSISELIGEPVGGAKNAEEIPASVVLFTNEPTFVGNEEFRVMRISVAWGHGEGVVGTVGIKSDTIMILRSVKYPDRLYVLENNSKKPKRLCPVLESGKIILKKVDNPEKLANQPALSHDMLTRLFYLGIAVEKNYGGKVPIDMELIVKNGNIYPVQARPVNRPEALPIYLDWKKVPQGSTKKVSTEMFLPGKAEVLTEITPNQIVIADTLENAEKMFKQGVHKLVIVWTPEESSNSHPVVNFSGMGIPCFYKENVKEVQDLIKQAKTLVVCTQSGDFVAWDSKTPPSDCISKGYVVHPAKVAVSIVNYPMPKVTSQTQEIPKETKELINTIRAAEANETALDAIKELKKTVETLNEHSVTDTFSDKLLHSASKLNTAFKRALSEFKAAPHDQRLHRLFHAKIIERLETQATAPGSLGNLSMLDVKGHLEAVKKIQTYQDRFDFPTYFHDEVLLSDYMMTPDQKEIWINFLASLESNGGLSSEKIKFKELLNNLQKFDLIPLWFVRFFIPSIGKVKDNLGEFIELMTPETTEMLQTVTKLQDEVNEFQDNLDLFADPEKCPAVSDKLIEFFAKLDVTGVFENGNPLVKIYAINMLAKAVDLYDKAIKKLKASTQFDEKTQIELFHKMLRGYYNLLENVTQNLSGIYLEYNAQYPLKAYLERLKWRLDESSNESKTLRPSDGFNVSAAILGYATSFARSLPTTKEDVFTLIHQSLIFSLQVLLAVEMKGKVAHPKVVEQVMKELETIPNVKLIGYKFPPGKMVVTYNYPLRNHSAMVEIHFDQATQKSFLHVRFLGQARQRWQANISVLKQLESNGLCRLVDEPKIDAMGMEYGIELSDSKSINVALTELQAYAEASMTSDNTSTSSRSFLIRLIKYEGLDKVLEFVRQFGKAAPSIDNLTIGEGYASALAEHCRDIGKDSTQLVRVEQAITILFSSPALSVTTILSNLLDSPLLTKISKDFVQKFSNSTLENEKLAAVMIDSIFLGEKSSFDKFMAFPPSKIPPSFRFFLYSEFIKKDYSIPNILAEVKTIDDPRAAMYSQSILANLIGKLPLIELVPLIKFENKKTEELILRKLIDLAVRGKLIPQEFQIVRDIYTKISGSNLNLAANLAFECFKHGYNKAIDDVLKLFDELDARQKVKFWNMLYKGKQEQISVNMATVFFKAQRLHPIFRNEALMILVKGELDPAKLEKILDDTLIWMSFESEESGGKDPFDSFCQFSGRTDLEVPFILAAFKRLSSPEAGNKKWWYAKVLEMVKKLPSTPENIKFFKEIYSIAIQSKLPKISEWASQFAKNIPGFSI